MKHTIKTIMVIFAVMVLSSTVADAQSRKGYISSKSSTAQIEQYFRDNIDLLDPIEGVYAVEHIRKSWNAFRSFPDANDNFYEVIVESGNQFKTLSKNMIFTRIGETNVYNCKMEISGPKGQFWLDTRVVLENGTFFNYSLQVPTEFDSQGGGLIYSFSFVKDYPTPSVYEAALKKKIEEETKVTDWSGSGFALNDGYVCTNYHVVDGAKTIKIRGVNGNFSTSYPARVVASDKYNDLAVLKIDSPYFSGFGAIPYTVKSSMDEVGEEIFVLGYPLTATMGDEIKLTTGVISSKTGFQGDVSLYQISAPIQPGNSGGPLFDSGGDIVGIVNSKHGGAENVGYAVKSSYLQNLLASSLSGDILPAKNSISSLPLTGKVSRLRNFVFYIECSSKASSSYSSSSSTYSSGSSTTHSSESSSNSSSSTSGTSTSSSSSGGGSTGSSTSKKPLKYVERPAVQSTTSKTAYIKSVGLYGDYTAIEVTYQNTYDSGGWCSINKNAYIIANGQRYTMIRAENIAVSPEKTYFSYKGETLTFTLYFPSLSIYTKSISLIESDSDSDTWKWYGISL